MRTFIELGLSILLLAVPLTAAPAPAGPDPNPLQAEWKTPFGLPPFDRIRPEHFLPAFEAAVKQHGLEIAAITGVRKAPTFENTVAALDDSGELLARVTNVFGVFAGAATGDEMQAVEAKVKPLLAAHADDIYLNRELFARVKAVHDGPARAKLDAERTTLLDKTYRRFVRGGANLAPAARERLRAINAELAGLVVTFSKNLLSETNAYRLVVDDRAALAGLPDDQIAAAAEAARAAGLSGGWVFTLKAPSIWPFLQSSSNRDLRERILAAYASRCDHGDATDNNAVFARLAALRAEKAQLLGYPTWGHFVLAENMAKTPDGAYALLEQLWKPALAKARGEAAELQAMIDAEKGGFALAPADWRYYAEKVKQARYDLDEEAVRPYLPIEAVLSGAFTLAGKLYGVTFSEIPGAPLYHPEVRVFEAREKDGSHLGVLAMDFFPRPGKRGGAWCSSIRDQWIRRGRFVTPQVYTVFNFARPTGSTPALLTADEAETLFHEFGHALHGLFSHCRFRGSAVIAQDFVELPSQIMENWVFEPAFLKLYARHYATGEPMPAALVEKIRRAATLNQGFSKTEILAASFLDMDWHTLATTKPQDAAAFTRASMEKRGLIKEILPRYRTTYFAHAADEYAAGYYSYTWSEVLDSDAFQAFKEKGDIFDPATAAAFRQLLAKGGSEDPALLYRRFRGRDPKVDALLDRRGLR